MSERPASPGLVLDAEVLVAFFGREEGAETVRDSLAAISSGALNGYLNEVNAAEVWYVVKRDSGEKSADDHLSWLEHEAGLRFVSSSETWRQAAWIKANHRMSLGDAFALATGLVKQCGVLAGSDAELDAAKRIGVELRRIRAPKPRRS